MDQHTQQEKWTRYAAVYDKRRLALMPGYAEMLQAVTGALPFSPSDTFHLLDVGTGTGNLAEAVLSRFPGARVTGIDVSEGMLAVAQARVERFGDRVRLEQADLEQSPLTGNWDAVVSSLMFRCLSPERKGTFVQEVGAALRTGGITVHADVLLLPDGYVSDQNRRIWDERKRSALAQGQITEGEIREEEERRREYETGVRKGLDDFLSGDRFVACFRQHGFPDAEMIWRFWGLAIVAAQKR